MRVLFINTSESRGGAAKAAKRIMKGVQDLGVHAKMFVKFKTTTDSDVFSLSELLPNNGLFRSLDWIVLKIKNKWQHLKWRPYKKTRSSLYLSDLRSTSLHGSVDWQDYDVIHLHWVNQRFLDIKELKRMKKPIVWTLHDCWPFCGVCHLSMECAKYKTHCGECPMLGSSESSDLASEVFDKKNELYKGLDLHVVCPSNWLADCARESALFGSFPIHVIPNCIDTALFSPGSQAEARIRLGLEAKKKYILFGAVNATNDPNKGFDRLVKALAMLDSDTNVELLVFGAEDTMKTSSIAIPSHVLGEIKDESVIVDLYNAADVTVVPSRSENLSNTIMESLSCGTPVVAFNIGGNSDMIDHKKNGWLAEDINDLAAGVSWCLGDNRAEELPLDARKKVIDNFTIEKVGRQYASLYESMI